MKLGTRISTKKPPITAECETEWKGEVWHLDYILHETLMFNFENVQNIDPTMTSQGVWGPEIPPDKYKPDKFLLKNFWQRISGDKFQSEKCLPKSFYLLV